MTHSHDDLFELELDAMAHGGSALGRHDGRTIFVPYTIPGEIVEARIQRDKGRIAFAEGVRLLDASADRVFPQCPHFGPGRCGRCQWQHIDYAAQLLLKQDVLADQLARIGGFDDADVRAVIASPQQWGYNHHMMLTAIPDGQLGFAGSMRGGEPGPLAIIEECHILHPDLLALYNDLDLDFTGLLRLRLQIGTDGAHMMILYVKSEDDAPELSTDVPTSVNLILPDNEPVNLIGESHTRCEIGGREFRITAGADFRANVAQLDTLGQLVRDSLAAAPDSAVLELYAGVGFFSAYIAPVVGLVTLVESFPPAATDADENLADFDNVDIIEGTVEDVLSELAEDYAVAVLDPPAEGLSLDAIDLLGDLAIPRLVYVSADPATLARDAKRLAQKGYALRTVQPIDLNPQTYYIDAVAVLEVE